MSKLYTLRISGKKIFCSQAKIANTFFTRFFGLIGKKSLSSKEALIFEKCKSVHMFFMRFPIDILFLDSENQIIGIDENLKPWAISSRHLNTRTIIELSTGMVEENNLKVGMSIKIEPK